MDGDASWNSSLWRKHDLGDAGGLLRKSRVRDRRSVSCRRPPDLDCQWRRLLIAKPDFDYPDLMSYEIRRCLNGLALFVSLVMVAACSHSPKALSADVWAVVDDHEIKQADVDKAYRRVTQQPATTIEEELTTKLGIV